jgi:RNA recognition motif-containing protein
MELPSQTIYINNLNEKLKKPTLKKLLYMLFSQYGKVIQIVACKGIKLRGQVISSAIEAIRLAISLEDTI